MTVQVPSARIDGAVEDKLKSLVRTVRLDGFRPGKVPLKVIQKRYGAQVRGEVLTEVLESSYAEALNEQNLRPAGAPEIEPTQMEPGKDVEYVATFEVLPDVEVKGIEDIAIERPVAEIVDEDIDSVIDNIRKQQAEYESVEREAQDGDRVRIDFKGDVNGEDFPGSEGSDVPVVIGSKQMPEEFEQGLIGMKAGDKKDIAYTFPSSFPTKEVEGKDAVFHVEAKAVEQPRLPDVDDAFAERLGVKEGGVSALREHIRKNIERERNQIVRRELKQQVMSGLDAANDFDLPRVLVDGEIDSLRQQAKGAESQGQEAEEKPEAPASAFEDEARRRVKLGLIINDIVRANGIELDRDRVRQALLDMSAGYERPQEIINYYVQNRKLMESVEVAALEDQVVDWVVERAKVSDKPTTFQELLRAAHGSAEPDAQED